MNSKSVHYLELSRKNWLMSETEKLKDALLPRMSKPHIRMWPLLFLSVNS